MSTGVHTKNVGHNQWKIPLVEGSYHDDDCSIYHLNIGKGVFIFFRCFASHINPHTRVATLKINALEMVDCRPF